MLAALSHKHIALAGRLGSGPQYLDTSGSTA